MMKKKKITLKELAKNLNVSISTVSKALNDSHEISKATKRKIQKVAKQYNYTPNKPASSLKSGKTKTIGVIIPNILDRFLAKVLYGIEREANNMGYNIITCISNESLEKEKQSIQLLSDGSVDGFILAPSEDTLLKNEYEHFNDIIKQGYPIVMFDRTVTDVLCDEVIINNFVSTFDITKEFIAQKKCKIAFISSITELKISKLREDGYKSALAKHGLDSLSLKIKKEEDKQVTLKLFMEKHPEINAIISADDTLGTIAINVALSLGYKVPKDISIVGFASESVSNLSIPKLTIIKQHAKDIGKNAVNLLINKLQKETSSKKEVIIVKTSLIRKGSF